MARLSNIERGARIALDTSIAFIAQPSLFADPDAAALVLEMRAIAVIAHRELDCCAWAREVSHAA